MISVGDFSESRLTVTEKDTAESWGSGTLPVLATPRMILLIEQTACDALKGEYRFCCVAEAVGPLL